jgi:hypothetical protein
LALRAAYYSTYDGSTGVAAENPVSTYDGAAAFYLNEKQIHY